MKILQKLVTGFILAIFVFANFQNANGQNHFEIAAGAGILETFHVAPRYQIKQIKVGVSVGNNLGRQEKSMAYSADLYYHFAGKAKHTDVRPWYIRSSVHFERFENDVHIINRTWFALRGGKEFTINKNFGIAIDLGLAKRLHEKETIKKPYNSWNLFDFTEWPSGALQVYYRF